MFSKLTDWLFNRALRLSHSATVALAKKTGQSAEAIQHLNDAGAALVISKANDAISKGTGAGQ